MRFIDPYDLLQLNVGHPDEVDVAMLRKAKQRLLAEFELSEEGFVFWQDERIDKTTAIELWDRMAEKAERIHFWTLRNIPGLANFLRKPTIQTLKVIDRAKVTERADFQRFCSPFVAVAVQTCLSAALQKSKWADARYILVSAPMMVEEDYEIGFKGAVRFVQTKTLALEQSTFPLPRSFSFQEYYETGFIEALNKFPDQYQQVRNRYAEVLGRFSHSMHKETAQIEEPWHGICAATDLKVDVGIAKDNKAIRQWLEAFYLASRDKEQREKAIRERDEVYAQWTREAREADQKQRAAKGSRQSSSQGLKSLLASLPVIFLLLLMVWALSRGHPGTRTRTGLIQFPKIEIPKIPDIDFKQLEGMRKSGFHSGNSFLGERSFYDSLANAVSRKPNLPALPRPNTGDRPYVTIFDPEDMPHPDSVGIVHVHNTGKKDVVLFFESGIMYDIVDARYLRAGESFGHIRLPAGIAYVRVYNGGNWVPALTHFDGKPVPGFTYAVEHVGTRTLGSKPNHQAGVLVLIKEDKPLRVTFNGEEFRQWW